MMRAEPQPQMLESDGESGEPLRLVEAEEGEPLAGTLKWFDVTRGFGFIVADDPEVGDILIHFSVLQPHGRRSLPEGAPWRHAPPVARARAMREQGRRIEGAGT